MSTFVFVCKSISLLSCCLHVFCHAIQYDNLENGFTKDPHAVSLSFWFDLWASISTNTVKDKLFVQSNLERLSCIEEASDNLDAALLIILPLLQLLGLSLCWKPSWFYVGSVRAMRTHNGMPGRMRRTGRIVLGSGFCHSAEQLSAVDNVLHLGPVVHTLQVLERIGVV